MGTRAGLVPLVAAMKEDAPTPNRIPTKRREMDAALDRWIAEWLARPNLRVGERKRLEEEKERRKQTRKAPAGVALGILHDREGMTPAQRKALTAFRAGLHVTSETNSGDFQAVVKLADVVFAAPKHAREPVSNENGVWAGIRYARHRKVPVHIVLPDGKER